MHIRRGVDRRYEFCQTNEGTEAYGWRVTTAMCYPAVAAVAAKLKKFVKRHRSQLHWWPGANVNVFLATDSPDAAGLDEGLLSFSLPHSSLYGESI